jgi:hypothetical protein
VSVGSRHSALSLHECTKHLWIRLRLIERPKLECLRSLREVGLKEPARDAPQPSDVPMHGTGVVTVDLFLSR